MSKIAQIAKGTSSSGEWLSRHWFMVFVVMYGLWVWVPFLAPLFVQVGWDGPGRAVYFVYSFFCHQLPERSFFLFGEKTMYSLTEIQRSWQNTIDPFILRKFIGTPEMGWKVAWSDRMIWFYTSVWLFALAWWPVRRKVKPLSWFGFILLLLPLALDGSTHLLSDLAGIGQGFRENNEWLAVWTNFSLQSSFYAGNALGSFNFIMRLITGLLAGLGIVWLVFPHFFQSQTFNQELDSVSYGKVLSKIQNENPNYSG